MPVAVIVMALAVGFVGGWLTGRPAPDKKMAKEDVATLLSLILKGEKPYDAPLFRSPVNEIKTQQSVTTSEVLVKKDSAAEESVSSAPKTNPKAPTNHGN